MIIYLIFFTLSFLFMWIASKKEKDGKRFVIYEILAIALLSFLASIRDLSIGTDVTHYVKPVFDTINKYGLIDTYYVNSMEKGYVLFNYIVSIFTNGFNVYLFFFQFFVLLFSYKGLKVVAPNHHVLAFILYVFLYYNKSFNVVRQSMAIALTLYSLKYLFSNEDKKFFIVILFAFLFHRTAAIFIIVYLLYKFIKTSNKNFKYLLLTFITFAFFFLLFFENIFTLLINIGILPVRYFGYLTKYYNVELDFEIVDLTLDVFLFLIYLLFSKIFKTKSKYSNLYFFMLLIDMFCLVLGARYSGANRLGLYFRLPSIIFIMSNFNLFIKEKNDRKLISGILAIIIVIIYWLYLYVYVNIGNTVPFVINPDLF